MVAGGGTRAALALLALAVAPLLAGAVPLELGQTLCALGQDALRACRPALWSSIYKGPRGDDVPMAAAATSDLLLVTGSSDSGPAEGLDVATVAFDVATGEVRWAARFAGAPHGADVPNALALSPDGERAYVAGRSAGAGTGQDILVLAYATRDGAPLWSVRVDGPAHGDDQAYVVRAAPTSGHVYVLGDSEGDFLTLALDGATGMVAWEARYDDPLHLEDEAYALAVSPDGRRVFAAGGQDSGGFPQPATDLVAMAYDAADGALLWLHTYDGPSHRADEAHVLAVSPDSQRLYVSAESTNASGREDMVTLALDAVTGERLWVHRYDGPSSALDTPYGIAVSPDGQRLYVAGNSNGNVTEAVDFATLAYDTSDGRVAWVARHNSGPLGYDLARALALSPDGRHVYVAGMSFSSAPGPPWQDMVTVAYGSATGDREWVARYDGPGNGTDVAMALALSPDGQRAYVAGRTHDGGDDIAAVAYAT